MVANKYAFLQINRRRFLNEWEAFKKVFFFQAEDGIRAIGVTGVQTCALPISAACPTRKVKSSSTPALCMAPPTGRDPRSEERRVGKEDRLGIMTVANK